jgi:hypothetical protein
MFFHNKKELVAGVILLFLAAGLFASQVNGEGSDYGVGGSNSENFSLGYLGHIDGGVLGRSICASGMLGASPLSEACGVYGQYVPENTSNWRTEGKLGDVHSGAYGSHKNGSKGLLGTRFSGVEAWGSDSRNHAFLAHGVYGVNSTGVGCGVWGEHYATETYGYLGSNDHAIFGWHSSGNYGYLGSVSNGAYVSHVSGSKVFLANEVWGANILDPSTSTSVSIAGLGCGVFATGKNYGIVGKTGPCRGGLGFGRIIGVWGQEPTPYGDKTDFAGLFAGDVVILGSLWVTDAGNKHDVVELDDGTWTTMTSVESPDAEYIISGKAKLVDGKARIEFNQPFPQVISQEIPVNVLVTPEGSWSGIYVIDVSVKGFTAASEAGDANATFSYMAVGRVKGKETKPDTKGITEMMRSMPSMMEKMEFDTKRLDEEREKMLKEEEEHLQEIEKIEAEHREMEVKHQEEMEKKEKEKERSTPE